MFVEAYKTATGYTRPIVLVSQKLDTTVATSLGAFVIVNDDGWIATAGHILAPIANFAGNQPLIQKYDQDLAAIQSGPGNAKHKRDAIRKLNGSDEWLRFVVPWFAEDGVQNAQLHVYPQLDLAVARLAGMTYKPPSYPTFKDPTNLPPGRSLMRLGYPFHAVELKYDAATNHIDLDKTNPAYFPIEGIHTRMVTVAPPALTTEGFPIKFIETSSPGLMGQSGGPLLDTDCNVWGIQSQTSHYELGFGKDAKDQNAQPIPQQYLSTGLAVHPEALRAVFAHHNIDAQWSAP